MSKTRLGGILESLGLSSKASRGTLSNYVINAPHQYGQPIGADTDAYVGVSPRRMREIVMKTPTAGAAFNAILDFATGVTMGVRPIDPAIPADPMELALAQKLMRDPNTNQTWRRFTRSYLRDLLTFGYAGVELEQTNQAIPNLNVLDNERIKVDYTENGTILGFNMVDAYGIPKSIGKNPHGWTPKEVMWSVLDESSNTLYGTSRVATLYACGVLESLMLAYIGGKFTDSNVPYGVLNLGEISDDELKKAIEYWNEQAENRSQHRLVLTGSKGAFDFINFGDKLTDLDATNLLNLTRRMIMGILGVTANELGESEDINKANGYNLSFVFKKRAIEPLLNELTQTFTKFLLHGLLGYTTLEFYYDEIDSRDELLVVQIDDLALRHGAVSINEVRIRKGLTPIPGGDEPMVNTGSAWIPVSMTPAFAKAQLEVIQLEAKMLQVQVMQALMAPADGGASTSPGAANGAKVSPPLIRAAGFPEKFTTPDGAGSSTLKLSLPKPQLGGGNKQEVNPKKTRGPVQTARAFGHRKEDTAA